MDAVEFLNERKRMFKNGGLMPCLDGDIGYNSEKAVKIVEDWSAAHPLKTRQSVFLEQYPKAAIDVHGVLQICPMAISDTYRDSNGECVNPTKKCSDCQREFWMQEVE